jgi:hypothetical protein
LKCYQRYSAFIFAGLLVLPLVFILAIQVYGVHLQYRALERLEEEALQTVSLPLAELVWEKKNKEVNIDGELFDVKTVSISGDEVVLTGLFDKKETIIKNLLRSQGSRYSDSVIQLLLFGQCFVALTLAGAFNLFYHYLKKQLSFFIAPLFSVFSGLVSPPPKASFLFIP